jgi:hypothetical protein
MRKVSSIFILALFVFASCTQEITINLDKSTPELVIDGAITNEAKTHSIYLRKSGDYFQYQQDLILYNALVQLTDGADTITLTQINKNGGPYQTPADYKGVPGRTYTLLVSNIDVDSDGVMEKYQATCQMLPLAPVDSISVEKKAMFRQDIWEVKLSMLDQPKMRNFYLSRVYVNGVCKTDSINEWGISNDEFFDGKYLVNETIMFLRSRKPDEKVADGDEVILEVCGVTEDYMLYIYEVGNEFQGRNPLFGGQPANIRTNVKRIFPATKEVKGGRGYFAAYSVGWGKTTFKLMK